MRLRIVQPEMEMAVPFFLLPRVTYVRHVIIIGIYYIKMRLFYASVGRKRGDDGFENRLTFLK